MKQVIVKSKISNYNRFEKKLSDIDMDFSPIFWQHDRIYVPRGYKRGMNYPRLIMRTEMRAVDIPPQYILIFKRHIEDSGIDIVEKTIIEDYSGMANIISQLGFKMIKEISKRRREIGMGEGTWIYLDDIDGANVRYAKIETTLKDDDSIESVKQDLAKTFSVLGEKDLIENSYSDIDY